MPILVSCPSCHGQLRVGDDLIGRKVRCPACQTVFEAAAPPPSPLPGLTPGARQAADLPVETVRVEPWRQLDLELASDPAPVPVPPRGANATPLAAATP